MDGASRGDEMRARRTFNYIALDDWKEQRERRLTSDREATGRAVSFPIYLYALHSREIYSPRGKYIY